MGSYSNTKFSVPQGADPMGIGVVDLGRSSYDPIQSIKEAWATERQDRIMKDENRRKEYEDYMKNLPPSYESVNGKISGELNQHVVDMGRLAYQRYKSGDFSPWARTEKGLPTEAELAKKEDYIATIGPWANKLDAMYNEASKVRTDPDQAKMLDIVETDKNMQGFANAQNIEEMMQYAVKPLLVAKPEEVELNKWFDDKLKTYMPKADVKETGQVLDKTTGNWVSTTTEQVDPKKARNAIIKIVNNATNEDAKYKRAIEELYKNAPESEKADPNLKGAYISVGEWFANKRMPETAVKQTKDFMKPDKDGNSNFSWGFGGRKSDGTLDFTKIDKGNLSMARKVGDTLVDEQYSSIARIPIQSAFKKPFLYSNTANSISTATGESAKKNSASQTTPAYVDVLPVAKNTVNIITPKGTVTILPGDKIPKDVLEQMDKDGRGSEMEWQPFVVTGADYKGGMEESTSPLNPGSSKTPNYGDAVIHPFSEILPFLSSEAKANGVDIKELVQYVNDITNNANAWTNSNEKKVTDMSIEASFDAIFNK